MWYCKFIFCTVNLGNNKMDMRFRKPFFPIPSEEKPRIREKFLLVFIGGQLIYIPSLFKIEITKGK